MNKSYPGEQWKKVKFDFDFTNDFRLEVSNFGRLRTFNVISDGNLINGSMINGYRIIRLKLYTPRDKQTQKNLDILQQRVFNQARKLKKQKENKESKKTIAETAKLLETLKANLSKKFHDNLKERTVNYHSLFHRLVADYFLKKPNSKQLIVAHLDHDKLNNKATNLKWMTPEENYEHQKSSPLVIKEKKERRNRRNEDSNVFKLTVPKVMQMKKMINEGKPIKQLVKQFKVTDTQIRRIMRGENWGDIKAAK